jgi:hypothetical protein
MRERRDRDRQIDPLLRELLRATEGEFRFDPTTVCASFIL